MTTNGHRRGLAYGQQQQQQQLPGNQERLDPQRWLGRFQAMVQQVMARPEFQPSAVILVERAGRGRPRVVSVAYPGGLIVVGTDRQVRTELNNRISTAIGFFLDEEDTDSDSTITISSSGEDSDDQQR